MKEQVWFTETDLWAKLKPLAREKRHEPTLAEAALWEALRNRQLDGWKFRRQHTIERFIADFYCADAQLIIEVDGEIRQYTQEEDALRTACLEAAGMRVLRFSNDAVLFRLEEVIARIRGERHLPNLPSPFTERGWG